MSRLVKICFCLLLIALPGCVAGTTDGGPLSITGEQPGLTASALESNGNRSGVFYALVAHLAGACAVADDGTDSDADGIADGATYTLDCAVGLGSVARQVTGTIIIGDDSPGVDDFAFTASLDLSSVLDDSGKSGTRAVDVVGRALAGGAEVCVTGTDSFDVLVPESDEAGAPLVDDQVDVEHDWCASYAADAPWTPGNPFEPGTFDTSGSLTVGVDPYSVTTPVPLDISPGCPGGMTGGQLDATITVADESETVVLNWSECSTVTAQRDDLTETIYDINWPPFAF